MTARRLGVFGAGALAVLAIACERGGGSNADSADVAKLPEWYAPPPAVRSYPSSSQTIREWIRSGDTASIRAHAWDIWESITTNAPQNASMPVWETWYSGHEIFDAAPNSTADLVRRAPRHRFEVARQIGHTKLGRRIGPDFDERWFGFNRYTRPTARFIYLNRLWDYQVLKDTNDAFNRLQTPVAQREVKVSRGEVDAESIVLKAVFQFINGTQASCIPYWNGHTSATSTNPEQPIAMTWKQFVIVDPTGTLDTAKTASGAIGCPPGNFDVVPLSSFYYVTITQEMADSMSAFAVEGGDDLGAGNDTAQDSITKMVKAGNIALLAAMHVTGKEIVEWTWQTFWWSPTPNDSLGFDRPSTIGAPWNNYQMNTAYYMVSPAGSGPKGTPRVAYNPYLETSLCGNQPTCADPTWHGISTNCMSCHRQAAWKDSTFTVNGQTFYFTGPPYVPAQYVDKGNVPTFGTYTKTDFLWSVAIRTRNFPKAAQ